jgi:hypothetical protein
MNDFVGHTPGPWEILHYADHAIAIHRDGRGSVLIGCVDQVDGKEDVCISDPDRSIIAAAPDLLAERDRMRAALTEIASCTSHHVFDIVDIARKALEGASK